MLALEPLIVARLQAAMPSGWLVKGDATSSGDRRPGDGPVAVVSLGAVDAAAPRGTASMLHPAWSVVLATRKGPATPALIDDALHALIGSLHNWQPGEVSGRRWEPMQLSRVSVPPPYDDGITGLEVTFSTAALYRGQP